MKNCCGNMIPRKRLLVRALCIMLMLSFVSEVAGQQTILVVYSNVYGFDVWFDGHYLYTAPSDKNWAWFYNVSAGRHTITLKKSGCADATEVVDIIAGVQNEVTIYMACGSGPTESEDTDDDGVPDKEDNCYNPDCNIVDSRGCPKDSDKDGVNECDDSCPNEKGSSANDGCPVGDKDNDGVTDDRDSCYNPGCTPVDSQGCPKDSDSDNIRDCDDNCPSEAGPSSNDGCPVGDKDGDGVTDDRDSCYNPGCTPVDSQGCPKDSDSDGVDDCEDNCPSQYGERSNNGCPEDNPDDDGNGDMTLVLFGILGLIALVVVGIVIQKTRGPKEGKGLGKTEAKETGREEEITEKTEIKKIICPFCKNEIDANWVSCPHCGTKLADDTQIY